MSEIGAHYYRVGTTTFSANDVPAEKKEREEFIARHRKKIEPWLTATCQAEHLNLLLGSGFTSAVSILAGAKATSMGKIVLGSHDDEYIDRHAIETAKRMGRGEPNIEDQFRSALAVLAGREITDPEDAKDLRIKLNEQMGSFLRSLIETERGIKQAKGEALDQAEAVLQSFLLSFVSRTASRERLHVFTTNYDRLLEYGCDLAGIRTIDRFVGALNPVFRASRVDVDYHYNPPGIRGEPRFMEGVMRLTKLHGSLDWSFDPSRRSISRIGLPFGAENTHSAIPTDPVETVMIYPNPAKDFETTYYPYAELFRDFAASVCRPNAVLFVYGYGFGDDHINRIILDMLSIPSTHIVIVARSTSDRLTGFLAKLRDAQTTLLIGTHFTDIETLSTHYLPKPALDFISMRLSELMKKRPLEVSEPVAAPVQGDAT
ncbi:fibronectin-binding protein (FBP) [Rhizobium leguminosarum]|uniref:SIR2 family protein n=1 Tax=Rhizobium leguminosarum TaxID=384 RepID=UPI00103127DF|nr:SIR2 family protein [Rhizobium leguminosarum]TAX93175.1 fibronectin-binding protein (FBP) [Rhizobium leguminosarum]